MDTIVLLSPRLPDVEVTLQSWAVRGASLVFRSLTPSALCCAGAESKAHTDEKHSSLLAACPCPHVTGLSQIPVLYCDLAACLKQH